MPVNAGIENARLILIAVDRAEIKEPWIGDDCLVGQRRSSLVGSTSQSDKLLSAKHGRQTHRRRWTST